MCNIKNCPVIPVQFDAPKNPVKVTKHLALMRQSPQVYL